MNQIPESKDQYISSRKAFTVDYAMALTIITLASNAYLSGFLDFMGVNPSANGILSSVVILAAVAQPFGGVLAQRIKKRKPFVTVGTLLQRLLIAFMFFVPVMTEKPGVRITLVVVFLICSHFIGAFISPAASNWIISLTPQRLRGRYFSIRELYGLSFLSVITLAAGWILDYFKAIGNIEAGFLAFGFIALVLTIVNFTAHTTAMEPISMEEPAKETGLLKAFKMVLSEKLFRPVLIMIALYNISIYFAVPYFGLYVVKSLKISYFTISVLSFIASVEKALIVRIWGKIADRTSWAFVCKISFAFIGVIHILNLFLVQENAFWLYPVCVIVGNIGWASIGMAILNIQYDYAPLKGRTMYIGISSGFAGIVGFASSLLGALVLDIVGKYKPIVFGIAVEGQQVQMIISGLILIYCVFYIKKHIDKNKKIINKTEGMANLKI